MRSFGPVRRLGNAMLRVRFLMVLACVLAAGCARHVIPLSTTEIVVVRHAEKAVDGSRDPPLSDAGHARARALSAQLGDTPLAAAYATAYRRTQQTAQPAAQAHGIEVRIYDAAQPAETFAQQLRQVHPRGRVLVVGHSNTAPQLAAALCSCTVAPLGENDYGTLYRIAFDPDGRAVLQQENY